MVQESKGITMRVPAAIVLATLVATPAMAIDIVSGSGAVIKNGAGLTVVNGDPCAGRMEAVCLDRQGDRRQGGVPTPQPPAVQDPGLQDPGDGCEGDCSPNGDYPE